MRGTTAPSVSGRAPRVASVFARFHFSLFAGLEGGEAGLLGPMLDPPLAAINLLPVFSKGFSDSVKNMLRLHLQKDFDACSSYLKHSRFQCDFFEEDAIKGAIDTIIDIVHE